MTKPFPGNKLFINSNPIWIFLLKLGMLFSILSYLICFVLLIQMYDSWAFPYVVIDVSQPIALATMGIVFQYMGLSDIFIVYEKYIKFYGFPVAKFVPRSEVDEIKLIYYKKSNENRLTVTVNGKTKGYWFENKRLDSFIEFAEKDSQWNEKVKVELVLD